MKITETQTRGSAIDVKGATSPPPRKATEPRMAAAAPARSRWSVSAKVMAEGSVRPSVTSITIMAAIAAGSGASSAKAAAVSAPPISVPKAPFSMAETGLANLELAMAPAVIESASMPKTMP